MIRSAERKRLGCARVGERPTAGRALADCDTAATVAFLHLIHSPDATYRTTVMAGIVDLSETGIRVLGVFWLLTAIAFLALAGAALTQQPVWMPVALTVTLVSLSLSLVAWPESRLGVPVNVLIIVALLLGPRFGLI